MKKYILCCLVLIAFASSYAQDVQTVKSDWTVASENKIVVVSKRTVQLDDVKNGLHREYVQFKYKNKTAQQVHVSFYFDAKYQLTTTSSLDDENYRSFLLDPNQEFTPSFLNSNEKTNFVFKRLLNVKNKPELITVQLAKIKTNIIK